MSGRNRPGSPSRRGAVWVANAGGPSVSRIDPATNRVVATIRVGPTRRLLLPAHGRDRGRRRGLGRRPEREPARSNRSRRRTPSSRPSSSPIAPCAYLDRRRDRRLVGGRRLRRRRRPDRRCARTGTRQRSWASRTRSVSRSPSAPSGSPSSTRTTSTGSTRAPAGWWRGCRSAGARSSSRVGFGSVWVHDDHGRVLRIQPTS